MKYVRCDSHCKYPAYTQDEVYSKEEVYTKEEIDTKCDSKFRKTGVFRLEKHAEEQILSASETTAYTRIKFETGLGTTDAPFEMITKTDTNGNACTGIKIKTGVSKVVVSGAVYISNTSNSVNSYNTYIEIEDENGAEKGVPNMICTRTESVPANVGTSILCPAYLFEVEENDIIFVTVYRDFPNKIATIPAMSPVRTYLTVEVAE